MTIAPPPGWPDGVPAVPAQARISVIGSQVVADMPYARWRFAPTGLISYTAYNGQDAGTVTKGPAG